MAKRQIALSIVTTGYEARYGDRVTSIAALEYIDGKETDNHFIATLQPDFTPAQLAELDYAKALATPDFTFINAFRNYIRNDEVIVHNAVYVTSFIDNEMNLCIEAAKTKVPMWVKNYFALSGWVEMRNKQQPFTRAEQERITDDLANLCIGFRALAQMAKTEWLSLCVDRNVIDIMEMDQKLFPRRAGYSHKLTDMAARAGVAKMPDYSAENLARMTMQTYLHLQPLLEKKLHKPINPQGLFALPQNATPSSTVEQQRPRTRQQSAH